MFDKNSSIEGVFDAIKEEMEYQDKLWGERYHSPAEWILFMRDYLREAENILSRMSAPKCNEDVMHTIRKVATMAIRCMEQNGIMYRNMDDLKMSCELHGIKHKDEENE